MLYRSNFDIVRDFLHDESLGDEDKVLARYLKPDLLIIGDMGMKQLPKRSGEYLFEIIMPRFEPGTPVPKESVPSASRTLVPNRTQLRTGWPSRRALWLLKQYSLVSAPDVAAFD